MKKNRSQMNLHQRNSNELDTRASLTKTNEDSSFGFLPKIK